MHQLRPSLIGIALQKKLLALDSSRDVPIQVTLRVQLRCGSFETPIIFIDQERFKHSGYGIAVAYSGSAAGWMLQLQPLPEALDLPPSSPSTAIPPLQLMQKSAEPPPRWVDSGQFST